MSAVALSFDKDVPARQSFGISRQCGSVPPPANDNSAPLSITPNCTVLSFFQAPPSASLPRGGGLVAPRAPRFGAGTYDQDGQVASINATATAGQVQGLSYAYDPSGNITSITDAMVPARSQAFTYDALDRLTDATGVYGATAYTYDGVGN